MVLQVPGGPELLIVLLMLAFFGAFVGVAVIVAVVLLRRGSGDRSTDQPDADLQAKVDEQNRRIDELESELAARRDEPGRDESDR